MRIVLIVIVLFLLTIIVLKFDDIVRMVFKGGDYRWQGFISFYVMHNKRDGYPFTIKLGRTGCSRAMETFYEKSRHGHLIRPSDGDLPEFIVHSDDRDQVLYELPYGYRYFNRGLYLWEGLFHNCLETILNVNDFPFVKSPSDVSKGITGQGEDFNIEIPEEETEEGLKEAVKAIMEIVSWLVGEVNEDSEGLSDIFDGEEAKDSKLKQNSFLGNEENEKDFDPPYIPSKTLAARVENNPSYMQVRNLPRKNYADFD